MRHPMLAEPYHIPLPSKDFCLKLLQETGVMLVPGSVMDMEGYVRIGYSNGEHVLREGLVRLTEFLRQYKTGAQSNIQG